MRKSAHKLARANLDPSTADMQRTLRQFIELLHACGFKDQYIQHALCSASRKGRKVSGNAAAKSRVPHNAGHLLTLWFQTPALLDSKGYPRPLPLTGNTHSLESLAASIAGAESAVPVVRYLRRVKGIRETRAGWVPTSRKLLVDRDPAAAAWHGFHSIAGLLKTIDHNVKTRTSANRRFESRVFSGPISIAQKKQINRVARELGDEFLSRLDRVMRSTEETGLRTKGTCRVGVGAYFYETIA